MSRLVIAEVSGSRSKAIIPAPLMEKLERAKWERFIRDLLRVPEGKAVTIRESE